MKNVPRLYLTAIAAILVGISLPAYADTTPEPSASGQLVNWRPQAELLRTGSPTWQAPEQGALLNPGDAVRTGPEGKASVLLADESLVQLNRNTSFVLKQVAQTAGWLSARQALSAPGAAPQLPSGTANRSTYEIQSGEIWLRNKNIETVIDLKTPTVSAGIRGTEISLRVAPDGSTRISVLEGIVAAENQFGSLEAGPREEITVLPGQAPKKSVLLTPENAVQWTLAIPPLPATTAKASVVAVAYHDLQTGEIEKAYAAIKGEVASNSQDGQAWTLLALIDLIRGKPVAAIPSAEKAITLSPKDGTAWLVQSYAYQGTFQLEEALVAAKKSAEVDPHSSLAQTNLAKIYFGMDRIDEALIATDLAEQFDTTNAEVYSIRGFLLLARRKPELAATAFQKAIALDSANGEPHLGLSLVLMRQDNIAEAVKSITRAVVLEPRRSLFVSYWAKMLYEKKRFTRALELLQLAKVLDPRDPTPNLYKAVILRDLNRPTEAIGALNEAITQNDNRAVYRSRFLLDRDLATKNVNLAILYDQLGLSAWAKSKAVASIKQDYSNSAAHLFLAGSLVNLEGRSPAASSEAIVSAIMQPANLNSFNTFNEYTTFFEQPDTRGYLATTLGNFNYQNATASFYGAVPEFNLAYSGFYFYSTIDGWRNTNYTRANQYVTSFKWDPTPNDGLFFNFRFPSFDSGDNSVEQFEYDALSSPDDKFELDSQSYIVGYRHHFDANSDFLGYARYENQYGNAEFHSKFELMNSDGSPFPLESINNIQFNIPNYVTQGQFFHRIGSHQLIAGTYQYWAADDADYQKRTYAADDLDNPLLEDLSRQNTDNRFESYYVLDVWQITPWLSAEGALYYDHQQRDLPITRSDFNQTELSPRGALVITPTEHDTLRLAAFRYLSPFFDERLDPTDIGGVTVYRGALEGTLTNEADAVVEHEWDNGFATATIFYIDRQVRTEVNSDIDDSVELDFNRGYGHGAELTVNQMLWTGAGLGVGYRYKSVERLTAGQQISDDHLAAAQLKQQFSNGLNGLVRESYRSINFRNDTRPQEDIWISDAALGYELPRKFGSVTMEVRNIFDSKFNWVVDDFVFIGRVPRRELVFSFVYNFNPY